MKMRSNALAAEMESATTALSWQTGSAPFGQARNFSTPPLNPPDPAAALAQRIEQAHTAFIQRTRERITRATELTSALDEEQTPVREAALAELRALAHSLAGTAGSFGYAGLSEVAETLETAISAGHDQYRTIPSLVIEMAYEFLDGAICRKMNTAG